MLKTCRRATACAIVSLASAASGWSLAADSSCDREEATPTRPTPEAIRERARSIQALKDLLKDSDATVRLTALESMLAACDAATREIAYDMAFGSSDQSMRALALRHKLLSMTQFVVELVPPENASKDQEAVIRDYQLKHPVSIGKYDLAAGNFSPHGNVIGTVNGLEVRVQDYNYVVRMRLGEGGLLMGAVSRGTVSIPAKVALR